VWAASLLIAVLSYQSSRLRMRVAARLKLAPANRHPAPASKSRIIAVLLSSAGGPPVGGNPTGGDCTGSIGGFGLGDGVVGGSVGDGLGDGVGLGVGDGEGLGVADGDGVTTGVSV
jgi:hypothetical protein